ncbi:MAG: hypothetical protein DRO18_06345 [Thermoprotei archaeon]|nr:MAG: hypothetical protein DRO18_06345 [Thermoprotei archaeon]
MGIITLVSYLVAKEGYTFAFTGATPQCSKCRFKRVCVDKLRPGHVYRIVRVLNIRNRCPVNEYVVTVEVEEALIEASIPKRLAVEGMIIDYRKVGCNMLKCKFSSICKPKLLPSTCKVKVVKVHGKLKCPKGLTLVKALVRVV